MPLRSTTLRSNVHPKINGDSANCPARHAGCSAAFARAAAEQVPPLKPQKKKRAADDAAQIQMPEMK